MSNQGFWGLYEDLPPAKSSGSASTAATTTPVAPPSAGPKKNNSWTPTFAGLVPPVKRPKAPAPHVGPKRTSAGSNVASAVSNNIQNTQFLHSVTNNGSEAQAADFAVVVDVPDPYDPMAPNSFEEYLNDKKFRDTQFSARERAIEEMQEMERERERLERKEERASTATSNASRRSGASFPPPVIYHKDDVDDSDRMDVSAPAESTQSKSSVAEKMMRNMGWKGEGHGLGRNQQGIAAPIKMTRTGLGTGVIAPEPAPPATVDGTKPSKIALLRNMVGRGQVDPDLEAETSEECSQYGRVQRCYIDETKDLTIQDEEAVRIFVMFTTVQGAQAAISGLNGRFFGGRRVRASFYDETRFSNGNYRDIIAGS